MTQCSKLATVCDALNRFDVRYVLVGAQALGLWGSARATRDIDVLIEPTVTNARRLLDALGDIGCYIVRDMLPEHVVEQPVTMIADLWRVDVLTVAWSVHYKDAVQEAVRFEVDGVAIPTIGISHLIASKRTGRLQDAADVEVLEEIRARSRG